MAGYPHFDYDTAIALANNVWAETGLGLTPLRVHTRLRKHVLARQKLMYLLYKSGKCSFPQIALFLKRDHSTVHHGVIAHMKREGIEEMHLDYAKAGVTAEWWRVLVINADTGEQYQDVVEANALEGWFTRYKRHDGGNLAMNEEGSELVIERVEAKIIIRLKNAR